MTRWLMVVVLVLAAPSRAAVETQVIEADEITAAGITRISEIVTLIDGWTGATTDGYTWDASPNGLAPLQTQCWIVMVDGQRFDVDTFGAINLNLLPVSIDQITRVLVCSTPAVSSGDYTDCGMIAFMTRQPRPGDGLGFDAYALGGNETGDPGPYRYTDRGGSNVDAIGPDLALTVGGTRGRWTASVNASVLVHYFTDPAMRRRTTDILGLDGSNQRRDSGIDDLFFDESSPSLRQASIALRAGHSTARTSNHVFLAVSSARRYMHYSDVFGRETPADQRLVHAGIRGSAGRVTYESQLSENRLSRPDGARFDYDWTARRSRTRIDARVSPSLRIGMGLDHVWADTAFPLEDNTAWLVPVYGRMTWLTGPVRHALDGMMSFTKEDKADKIHVQGTWSRDGSSLVYDVSFVERLFSENQDIWFWTERGYGLLDSNGVDYTIDGAIGTSRTVTADAEWRWKGWLRTRGRVAVIYRHFDDLYLERHDYAFEETTCSFTGPTEVVTGQGGHVAGGRIRVTVPAGPWAHATMRYRYQRAFDGDAVFEDAWKAVPEHLASLRVTARPRPGLTAWLSLEWRSSTEWPDYDGVDGATCTVGAETVTYRSRVDDVFTVDAKVGKRLFGGRAAFDILGRNLLNESVRYHPAGASFDLSFFAQIRVTLR